MSILDKARNAINARKQAADEKATAEQRARDWRSNEAQRRAERFLEKLGLPASLKATVEDGIITIRHKRQVVVEITFDWTTRSEYENGDYAGESDPFEVCWIRYYAEWLPDGAREYQRRHTKRDTFYPDRDESQNELGEYLLRVLKYEFNFATQAD